MLSDTQLAEQFVNNLGNLNGYRTDPWVRWDGFNRDCATRAMAEVRKSIEGSRKDMPTDESIKLLAYSVEALARSIGKIDVK